MSRRGPARSTPGQRALDARGVAYTVIHFPEEIHDAPGVARHAGLPAAEVYKTLVALPEGPPTARPRPLLFVLPGDRTLDLKRAAAGLGLKSVRMARQAEAERLTGLKVGGISALALLERGLIVCLDSQAQELERFVVSAGQRGVNLRLRVDDYVRVTGARWIEASRPTPEPEAEGDGLH